MFRTLMTARRFAPLFWCQFFSAFNDNFLKNALAFLILYRVATEGAADPGVLVTLASAVFIGPFFILSGLGGELADRYDKALIARFAGRRVAERLLHELGLLARSLREIAAESRGSRATLTATPIRPSGSW
mgnify:CR=1 FL=1